MRRYARESVRFDKDTHTYYYKDKKVPSVTTILKELGVTPPFPDDIKRIQDARNVGIVTHKVLEFFCQGFPLEDALFLYNEYAEDKDITVNVQKAMCKISSGINWLVDSKAISLESEFSYANEKFGGTVDLIASINHTDWLIDWKTGSLVDTTSLIQVAAYCDLLGLTYGSVVHLFEKGYRVYDVEECHKEAWRELLSIYHSDASDKDKKAQAKSAVRFEVEVLEDVWANFLDAKSKFTKCKQELDQARENLVEAIGDGNNGSMSIGNFHMSATWVEPSETVSIDKKKFEEFSEKLPEEYAEQSKGLYKTTTRQGAHRITVKGIENV